MEMKIEETKRHIYLNLTPWERVQIARHPARPYTLDYLQLSFSDYLELHGDRLFGEDSAMPGGFATIDTGPASSTRYSTTCLLQRPQAPDLL